MYVREVKSQNHTQTTPFLTGWEGILIYRSFNQDDPAKPHGANKRVFNPELRRKSNDQLLAALSILLLLDLFIIILLVRLL
jgi:hypothetical protein